MGIGFDRIYDPSETETVTGPWFGLTERQRETLARAVEGGYYAVPHRLSTKDLAEEFGVSDLTISERLRRAVSTLARSSLVVTEP